MNIFKSLEQKAKEVQKTANKIQQILGVDDLKNIKEIKIVGPKIIIKKEKII